MKAEKWNDLDQKSKDAVLTCPLTFMGRNTSLRMLGEVLGAETLTAILEKYLDKNMMNEALRGVLWRMEDPQLDGQLPYYIPRTLTMTRELDPKVFRIKCPDIFVFEGLTPNQLSTLIQHEETALSDNQLDKLTVRYILLEREEHLEILLPMVTVPIHRVSWENARYCWVSTGGSVKLIREHLVGPAEEMSEVDGVIRGLSVFNARPIVIADHPGMGKSVLLCHLAGQVKEFFPNRYVLVVSLPKLLSFFQGQGEHPFQLSDLKRKLAECATTTKIGQEILFALMNCSSVEFEVFMDDVPSSQVPLVKQLLQTMSQSNNLRVIVATTRDVRDDLEHSVGAISWNIKAWTKEDQLNFFRRYWTTTLKPDNATRLADFVRDFVELFRSIGLISGDNKHDKWAGAPLLGYMLAHVYSEDAQRNCVSPIPDGVSHKIKHVPELYTKFMTSRFKDGDEPEMRALKEAHWTAAMNLIFPEWVARLEEASFLGSWKTLQNREDPERLLSLGILQNLYPSKFVHRTFAEYLVADFMVSRLLEKECRGDSKVLLEFLFGAVLTSKRTSIVVGVSNQASPADIFKEFVAVLRESPLWSTVNVEFERIKTALSIHTTYLKGYEDEDSLLNVLLLWSNMHGEATSYEELVKLLARKLDWPDQLTAALLQIPSGTTLGYRHPLLCKFLDALLPTVDNNERFDPVTLELEKASPQYLQPFVGPPGSVLPFFQQASMCVSQGLPNLFYFLHYIFPRQGSFKDLREPSWSSLVVLAARQDLSTFLPVSQFAADVYGRDLFHLDYAASRWLKSHTPLHEAAAVGNYPVVKFLLHKHDKRTIPARNGLLYLAASHTIHDTLPMVNRKLDVIRLLIETGTSNPVTDGLPIIYFNKNEKCVATVALSRPHVKILKFFLELEGVDVEQCMDVGDLVSRTLLKYTADEMDELVEFLARKQLLKLLFKKVLNFTALQLCISYGVIRPNTFQKICASHPFSLSDMGDLTTTLVTVVSKNAQPEMTKAFVETFDCVNVCVEEENYSLLMAAAETHSLASMKYLVSAGANVNAFSKRGASPLALVLNAATKANADSTGIHEGVQLLLESGADVNAKNFRGYTVLDMLEELNAGQVLEKRTIDLLFERSDKQGPTWKEEPLLKKEHKGNECIKCVVM